MEASMTTLLLSVAGVFALVFGASLLLFVLPGASIHHPSVRGLNYWAAVLGRTVGPGTVRVTLLGLALVVAGIAVNLRLAWPVAELQLGRGGRLLLFWGVTGLMTLALLGFLIGVTFVTLGLD
jgi:hypothetical protein